MNGDFMQKGTVLERYQLVGGPDSMIPALERVADACGADPALAEWATKQAEALFEQVPGVNVERWPVPEATAFWKRAFGRYPRAFACDSWLFNPAWQELIPDTRIAHSIDIFERLPSLKYNPDEPSGLFFVYDRERCDPHTSIMN